MLYDRKGEGSIALLELRQQEYAALANQVHQFLTIDASQPLPKVKAAVLAAIEDFKIKWASNPAVIGNK